MKNNFTFTLLPFIACLLISPQNLKVTPSSSIDLPSQIKLAVPDKIAVVEKDSVRWHYERALILQEQDKTAHAVIELYRSQEKQKLVKQEFEQLVKTRFTKEETLEWEHHRKEIENKKIGIASQQRLLGLALEELARKKFSPEEFIQWKEAYNLFKKQEMEINYLLGFLHIQSQRTIDAISCLELVADEKSSSENIPALLLLAREYVLMKSWNDAFMVTMQLVELLEVKDSRIAELKKINSSLSDQKNKKSIPGDVEISNVFKLVLDAATDSLLENPIKYRESTLGRKIKDPLIYNELIHLFTENGDTDEAKDMLQEAIRIRDGFSPISYLCLGDIYESSGNIAESEKKNSTALENYEAALKNYETAVKQLQILDFSKENGSLDLEKIIQVQKKIKTMKNFQEK